MKKAYVAIALMIALAPLFAWAADNVNYSEPLENAAEKTESHEQGDSLFHGIFSDYIIPGANPYVSALIAGIIGCAIILMATAILRKAKHG